MTMATNIGYPRIGPKRELKKVLEAFWKGNASQSELEATAKELRKNNWELQRDKGMQSIPSNDFSYYDIMLDTTAMVGAVPERYHWSGGEVDLATYFAMARGAQGDGRDVPAMEMTKWFDTNYHYIVPEFTKDTEFSLSSTKAVNEFNEAKALGITTRPVLIGPVTFLHLGKSQTEGFNQIDLLDKLLPVYEEILKKLEAAGAEWVQIDEPCLVLDIDDNTRAALKKAHEKLSQATGLKTLITTYFDSVTKENIDTAVSLDAEALHIDLMRGEGQEDAILAKLPENKILSLGVVDGRNIWKGDMTKALDKVEKVVSKIGADRVMVAPSCSMLHTPYDLDLENNKLDDELKNWMAFAKQKLEEIASIAKGAKEGREAIAGTLKSNQDAMESRKTSARIHNPEVKELLASATPEMAQRNNPFSVRNKVQRESLNLPLYPTTTIGSFPQTPEVRKNRAEFKRGDKTEAQYNDFIKQEIKNTVDIQEAIGIDVLVHGESERNDMVEYFGEQLEGYAFTSNGWVQSYGSRCVKPPVIFGDVSRPKPMTVEWSKYAQSQTDKIMKGMLTGPVTILQWSFVRDDQPRETTCRQIAFAIRDEVVDLEAAGIKIIQIDEPAVREGLPLHREDWNAYLQWAVESFRIAASGVEDKTQIHTHMCYAEFNDIMQAIADMDADVISIETSRSQMELLDAFADFKYPNEIGPGVYDIHSPRVPPTEEMVELLRKARALLRPDQIWVNPDCGLKTRAWPETKAALENMVEAAKQMRKEEDSKAA